MKHHARLLFILKRRHVYGENNAVLSSGLRNSVDFVVQMLQELGFKADMAEVADNNEIDRQVAKYKPTHVIIEAIWVVPEKFDILRKLHPDVRWIVRNHSELAFLSGEGFAMDWIASYLTREIEVMCNSRKAQHDIKVLADALGVDRRFCTYGPNWYPLHGDGPHHFHGRTRNVNVGCFGAIRPLKNQLAQAMAAIGFADRINMPLAFHVNGTRQEGSRTILRNLRSLFARVPQHTLVEHAWQDHENFLQLIRGMDISMQVSFSETFNIVSADAVAMNVPIVVSHEIAWVGEYAQASTTRTITMTDLMQTIWNEPDKYRRLKQQRSDLHLSNIHAEKAWMHRFSGDFVV